MRPFLRSLSAIKKKDAAIVGTKAFRLSQLIEQGLSVPPAFVLTTDALEVFIEENNLVYLIERLSMQDDRKALSDICGKLKRKIKKGALPKILVEELKRQIKESGIKTFAVRSSATSEDLAFASFAGQFESYLNVGPEEVFDYIKSCWQSLYEERVIAYTVYHHIPIYEIKMAVLLQEMILAEKGGVIFTKDVLRNNERVVVIEAVRGLGTKVVSGTAEPDRYIVEKSDLKPIGQRLKGTKPVLDEEEIFQLTSLGLLIENFYHSPQDIEWLIKDNQVFLLQTRPITI